MVETKYSQSIKTVIVAGAAGFIATNLIHRLLSENYRVLALDNLSRGVLKNLNVFQQQLNNRPRKRLGFKTPNEVFMQSLKRVALRT